MPRHRVLLAIALACAAAFAVGGCKNEAQLFQGQNDDGWFFKPVFSKPEWAMAKGNVSLGPQGVVGAEEMVTADGACATPAAAQAAESPPPADRAANDDAGTTKPSAAAASPGPGPGLQRLEPASGPLSGPQVTGGIGLGMTECQVVQRAGSPSSVSITAEAKGERKVVLTYLGGPWPGIYSFTGGRLNVVDRAPEPPKPAKATPKKKPSANTAQRESDAAPSNNRFR